jgi:hypothetical protein
MCITRRIGPTTQPSLKFTLKSTITFLSAPLMLKQVSNMMRVKALRVIGSGECAHARHGIGAERERWGEQFCGAFSFQAVRSASTRQRVTGASGSCRCKSRCGIGFPSQPKVGKWESANPFKSKRRSSSAEMVHARKTHAAVAHGPWPMHGPHTQAQTPWTSWKLGFQPRFGNGLVGESGSVSSRVETPRGGEVLLSSLS